MSQNHRRPTVCLLISLLSVALLVACGGGDSSSTANGDDDAENGSPSGQGGGPVEMVPLSSLNLDLPFERSYDPPVPSDASVANAIERQATANTHAGYDLTLDTSATYDDIQATYDEYVAGFEFGMAFPDSQAWTGRRAQGEPGITIGVIGGRLNIAEILDQ